MSTKGDTKDLRLSVTPKAAIAKELNEMAKESDLSKNDLFNVSVDVLYFVWNVIRRGGTIGVKMPGEKDFKPYEFYIPGMTKPFSNVS